MNTSHASAPALAAHTPGDWISKGRDILNADGAYIADVKANRLVSPEQAEANARLIAFAPDLLAALEAAHRSLVTCNSCHAIGTLPAASERAEIESATLLARAAIAKATTST